MDITSIIVIVLLAIFAFYLIALFNRLVALKNRFQNSFAQIEVQLKRRHDLIPNLVESSKAYLKHEQETLQNVIEARNSAVSALKALGGSTSGMDLSKLASAEGALTSALGSLNVAFEAYPDLKADQTIARLTEELTSTENRVAFARQAFNDDVTAYNVYKQSFPANVLAGTMGHGQDASLLEFADHAEIQKAPTVSF